MNLRQPKIARQSAVISTIFSPRSHDEMAITVSRLAAPIVGILIAAVVALVDVRHAGIAVFGGEP